MEKDLEREKQFLMDLVHKEPENTTVRKLLSRMEEVESKVHH